MIDGKVTFTQMEFMFPTTIALLTEMDGDVQRGRVLSVTEKGVMDTGTNLYRHF